LFDFFGARINHSLGFEVFNTEAIFAPRLWKLFLKVSICLANHLDGNHEIDEAGLAKP
jgi:hypothetical protein